MCPDGAIYPCDSFVGLEDFCIGNMTSGGFNRSLYTNRTVCTIKKCNKCNVKYLCGGDCYYNSFIKSGDALCPDMEFCQIQKHIIKFSIILCYKMRQTNEALYNELVKEVRKKHAYATIYG